MTGPRLSVVVISWNERPELERCLDALQRHPAGGGQEVIVVDNGSTDDTHAMLASRAGGVRVVANPDNRGVTVARNQGMRLCRGRIIAMLDSDAYVHPGALDLLCDHLDADPGVGLVGPRLLYEDGTLQESCRRVPSPVALLANRLPAFGRLHAGSARRRYLMIGEDHTRTMDVEYLLGAAMVFRRAVVERIGGFDERFGFSTPGGYGFDDADWALRVRAAGWRVTYVPDAVATHGYRRRLAGQPVSRAGLALGLSYLMLRLKHVGRARRGLGPS
ncbi:glycosyltransferase family 2 protein [Miltoncostaea oceani]|uniref:glycosyltransferase family 2 protein n=1 Tax=Miltoncostaea oceani TaxID=2843216 RepID=UPI001C3D29C9|nr:glycosyltransferase family 2 protein [Miltoncostaea oceani]